MINALPFEEREILYDLSKQFRSMLFSIEEPYFNFLSRFVKNYVFSVNISFTKNDFLPIYDIPIELSYFSKIKTLVLRDNKIRDLNNLFPLKGLRYLILSNNEIEDVSVLKYLPNLLEVYVVGNPLNKESYEIIGELKSKRHVDVSFVKVFSGLKSKVRP